MTELLSRVIELGYKINTETRATVFVEYAGHVSSLEVRVCLGGWRKDANPDIRKSVYLDRDDPQGLLKTLEEIYASQPRAPEKIGECDHCARVIYEGDKHKTSYGKVVCADCIKELTAEAAQEEAS